MDIKTAIQKAIEEGYSLRQVNILKALEEGATFYEYEILLDPLFWNCLFRGSNEISLQWKNDKVPIGNTHWLYQQHRFIDHLAEGGSIQSFFESLN